MSATFQPLVSLITLNFNQTEVTCQLLESCKQLLYQHLEIIVVDNHSDTDPTWEIQACYPAAKVYRSEKNLGFSGGMNFGMQYASGDYFLLLNNDTEVTDDLVEYLLMPFEKDPLVGIVSPKIRYFPEAHLIQYAGYEPINPYTGRIVAIGNGENDRNQHDEEGYTAYAHGAAMMVSRKVVATVGGIPEMYFLLFEELDWSEQIRRAGYQVYFQPSALVFHKVPTRISEESAEKTYYYHRNQILFMRRNVRPFGFVIFCSYYLLTTFPRFLLRNIWRRNWSHVRAVFRAMAWHLKNHHLSAQEAPTDSVLSSA
jgi:GT2 family glycosyltransferase